MTKNDSEIYSILMDIKGEQGKIVGLIEGMHEKQDYTNGRVNKLEDKINKIENDQTKLKTKVAIFATVVGSAATLLINIIKQKFGL